MNGMYIPIKPKRISEEIVEQIKNLIFQGKLKPGEKLLPERDLSRALNVSRVSLREALNTLQGMGLLEIQQGNRTFVRPITTLSLHDPLVSFIKGSSTAVLEMFELRKYLEIGCISLAAERAEREEVEELKRILHVMEDDVKKDRLGAKSDLDFHSTIARATHNIAYIHMMHTVYDLLKEELLIAWGSVFREKNRRRKLLGQHQNIFNAIEERNSPRAAQEGLAHLNFVQESWQSALGTERLAPRHLARASYELTDSWSTVKESKQTR